MISQWNTNRTWARHSPGGGRMIPDFSAGPCFMPYPPRYRTAFAFSDLSMSPLHLPALRSACHASRSWRSDDVSTFHVFDLTDNLGAVWTPVALRSRASTLMPCNLSTHVSPGEHAYNLLTPVGWGLTLRRVNDHSLNFTILSSPSP